MEVKTGLPAQTGPKDVFLHLLSIIALYVSAGAILSLVFQYINVLMPDPVSAGYYSLSGAYSSIRWSVAILIVVFPVYVWSVWFLQKMYAAEPARKELRTRRWLLYFTLFAAALIVIGDLVALIFNFLQGELTLRFLLKVITVFVVAGAVFSYYLSELRDRREFKHYLSYAAIVIVAVAVVAAFFVAGSPQEQRSRRFDDQRISDLQNIQFQIVNYWQAKETLPENISVLRDDIRGFRVPVDPETGESYEYKILSPLTFELCANFNAPSLESSYNRPVQLQIYPQDNWQHQEGRACFERKIDPDLYPPLQREGKLID